MARSGDVAAPRIADTDRHSSPHRVLMHIINHASLPREQRDGCELQTVAGHALGSPFEVQMLQLAPGAATPLHRDASARVVLVLAGSGKQRLEGAPQGFQGPCTVHVPAGAEHQFINNGLTPLQLVVIAASPERAAAAASPP
jgi:quercetin dioxygenase-like cupin family protein